MVLIDAGDVAQAVVTFMNEENLDHTQILVILYNKAYHSLARSQKII